MTANEACIFRAGTATARRRSERAAARLVRHRNATGGLPEEALATWSSSDNGIDTAVMSCGPMTMRSDSVEGRTG